MNNYTQQYQTPDGTGRLWKNDKEGNDRRPDISGDAMYNGQLIEIAGWYTKTKKDGSPCKPHFRITVKDKQQLQQQGMQQARQAGGFNQAPPQNGFNQPPVQAKAEDFDDDLPF